MSNTLSDVGKCLLIKNIHPSVKAHPLWLSKRDPHVLPAVGLEGLFEKTHLPDQHDSALYRGPSRGLHCNGFLESISFHRSRLRGGPLSNSGVDVALRRVLCQAVWTSSLCFLNRPWRSLFKHTPLTKI